MPKISIVVPVYNSSKTIERCLKSLLNQTYKNIEIVLVDDGSEDNSLKIMNTYKKNYDNIIVLHQKNKGAGEARNTGIVHSSGEYISFVDSDDELELDAIDNMVLNLKENTDIVISGFKKVDDDGKILFQRIPQKNEWTEFKYTLTVFKLYRKKFLKSYDVEYTKDLLYEDMYFSLNAYSHTNNIVVYPNDQYIIHSNPNSITFNYKNLPICKVNGILNNLYNEMNINKFNPLLIQYFFMKVIVLNVFTHIDGHTVNDLNQMYLEDYNWLKNKKILSNINIYWQNHEDFFINLIINTFVIFTKLKINKVLIFCIKKAKNIRLK